MNPIGIMQGRLSPPVNGRIQAFPLQHWADEFERAAACGLELLEWIFDTASAEANPIVSQRGIGEVLYLSRTYNVKVISLCADYFMEQPLIRAKRSELEARLAIFRNLIQHCSRAGVRFIGIPFVDHAAMTNESEMREAVAALRQILPAAADAGIVLALETSLSPVDFSRLLDMINHPNAKVNYDTGNSAALGYDLREEMAAYGEAIATIHLKDRRRGGGTVPLGTGNVDFATAFELFHEIGYDGPYILQAAREGDEMATAMKNLRFVKQHLHAVAREVQFYLV